MTSCFKRLGLAAAVAIGVSMTSEATLLVDVNFDEANNGSFSNGNVGVEGFFLISGGVGTTVNAAAGLEGAGALSIENPGRINANLEAGVAAQIGVDGTSIFGRYLVNNPTAVGGFTGIELDQGNFDTNRVIVLGEQPSNTPGTQDFVVVDLNPGNGPDTNAGDPGEGIDLALPAIVPGQTREIFFRIDYTAGQDTFNLINPDGSVISSASGNDLSFTRIGFAAFGGAAPIIYDEFELGTTLASVPEPGSLALIGLGGLLMSRRRRTKA